LSHPLGGGRGSLPGGSTQHVPEERLESTMSTERPKKPTTDVTVEPDNFHNDSTTLDASADTKLSTTVEVQPDNFHNDGTTA
jgi:hypothetical protein